jgi:hypothetical protein
MATTYPLPTWLSGTAGPVTAAEAVVLFGGSHTTTSASFIVVAQAVLDLDKFSAPLTMYWNQSAVPGGTAIVELLDVTGSSTLASLVVSSTGIMSASVTNPGGIRLLQVRQRRVAAPGSTTIQGVTLIGG